MSTLAEILQREAFVPLVASGDHAGILRLLHAETVDTYRSLTSRELLLWAAADGRLLKIQEAAANSNYPAAIRSICLAVGKMLDRDSTLLNMVATETQQMLAGLVQVGVLTADDSASLYALAATKTSIAAQELGGSVTMEMLGAALP